MDRYGAYNDFFYNGLCHVCKLNRNIKRCSKCKTIAYCSKEHQMLDWKQHRKICEVIADTDNSLPLNRVEKFQDLKKFKVVLSVLWKNKLGRPLKRFEEQMWMFPRVCVICFSNSILIDCENCLNVSYCSEEHKDEFKRKHSTYCHALKLCMDIDLYYFNKKYVPTDIKVKSFDDHIKNLPDNLEKLMILFDGEYSDTRHINTLEDNIQFIIKANYIGPSATVLFGLQKFKLVINREFLKDVLSIHIVGADTTEMGWIWKLIIELFFHWIKNIHILHFSIIGPNLYCDDVIEIFAEQLCDSCKKRKLKAVVTFRQKLYDDVVGELIEPDIVVAFNSGLHEFHTSENDTWKGSIKDLTKYPDVPLLLTAYTENEIIQDITIVKQNKCVRTVLEPQRNPFSNMTPIRDWEDECIPVFYINNYISILSA